MIYDGSDLVILVPMLGRPQNVVPLLATIDETTPKAEVLFLCSPHDVHVIAEVEESGCRCVEIPYYPVGDYARKINYGVRITTQPLIFLGAGDLAFHHGWFERACEQLQDGIGVVGTNDLGNPRVISGEHSTHSLITRAYAARGTIDDRAKVLHDGYHHEFVDDEFIETAKARSAYRPAPESVVEHLHPNWGKAAADSLYDQQRQRMAYGRRLYMHRRRLWQH